MQASEPSGASDASGASAAGESAHGSGSAGGDDADGSDAAEAAGSEGSSEEGGEAGAAEGGAPGKRKRRRRRKRKDGTTSTGDVAAASGEGGEQGAGQNRAHGPGHDAKKKESHAPFAHRFAGAAGNKRHAFAVGEVVAGRVQKVEYGVIVVDLFGKATAIADEYEPREVPVLPDPPAAEAEGAPQAQPADGEPVAAAEQAAVASELGEASTPESSAIPSDAAVPPQDLVAAPESDASSYEVTSVGELRSPEGEATISAAQAGHADESTAADAVAPAELQDSHDAQDAHDGAITSSGDILAADDESDDEHDSAAAVEPAREKPAAPAIGQVFKGRVGAVSESGHIAILNRLIDGKAVRAQLSQFREQHKRVHGVVYGYNRGGFDVLVEGLRAFCPASAMSLEDIAEPLEFVGKKLEFLLPASKAGSKDIIVSRRSILERLQRRKTK
ncbi:MAG: hypothetical protein ABW321_28390, partial [Polyangiales bacterium]